jgi:DNA-binding GntR family transcriptional regulator
MPEHDGRKEPAQVLAGTMRLRQAPTRSRFPVLHSSPLRCARSQAATVAVVSIRRSRRMVYHFSDLPIFNFAASYATDFPIFFVHTLGCLWYAICIRARSVVRPRLAQNVQDTRLDKGVIKKRIARRPDPETSNDLLSHRIAANLRERIVTDELPGGTRIPERTLAAELSVSRTPLREALKILAGDGLVTLLPNRGAAVAQPSAQEIEERLELLAELEGFAGRKCADAATEEEIREIRALHHEMLAAYERRDRRAYFHLNQKIHKAVVAAAHNRALITTHEQLNHQLYSYRFRSSGNPVHWQTAIKEHGEILDALTVRDGQTLSTILQAHLSSTWRQISQGSADAPADAERGATTGKRSRRPVEPEQTTADGAVPARKRSRTTSPRRTSTDADG